MNTKNISSEFAGLSRAHAIAFSGLLLFMLFAPKFIYPVLLMTIMSFALFAAAFNLLLGYTGFLSFGHAAFFGVGCYVTVYLVGKLHLTFEVAVVAAFVAALGLGAIIGALVSRSKGIYFAMATLAFAQIVYYIVLKTPASGGENGLESGPRGLFLGVLDLSNDMVLYYVVLAISALGIAAIYRISHSPFSQAVRAMRDDQARAVSLGYAVWKYKLAMFILSAGFSGLAGSLKGIVLQFASLEDVYWSVSGDVVLMTLIGGIGTVFGPLLGASLVVTLNNYIAGFGGWVLIIQGVVFALCIFLFRDGIVGKIQNQFGIKL
ncbi:MAG: branched-chain amino acid ABC transporter permease [Burkholderiaceae bacterium]